MNLLAVEHYAQHGIDLATGRLEVAVCSQHNNGGLAADSWWESTDINRFFPIGEVNGSHGVSRPGGAALNAGQVGAIRAASRIAGAYAETTLKVDDWHEAASQALAQVIGQVRHSLERKEGKSVSAYRQEFRKRMDQHGGIVRPVGQAQQAAHQAWEQFQRFGEVAIRHRQEIPRLLGSRQLALAHAAYLEAIANYAQEGGGSRGSVLMSDQGGVSLDPSLGDEWLARPDNVSLRELLQELRYTGQGFSARWIARRPIPVANDWFESVWKAFLDGSLYPKTRNGRQEPVMSLDRVGT
jgi:hypothetical protein